jgi:isopenicillin-N N-acyltransferase-like protein
MFPQVNISGEPHQRGVQYGQAAEAQIRHSIASYSRLFAFDVARDWHDIQTEALTYVPLLERSVPDLVEEMRGIAAGSGREFAEIVALNARTELLRGAHGTGGHPDRAAAAERNRLAGVPSHPTPAEAVSIDAIPPEDRGECTTVAVQPSQAGGETLLAQTWDWNGEQRPACLMLQVDAPGIPTVLMMTEGGIIGKIGLNSAGVGVSLNILNSKADGQVPGMPVHILLRRLLQCTSVAEGIEIAREVPAGGSSCITIADTTGQVVSLEVTPAGVGIVEPQDGLLVHTNHCLTQEAVRGEREKAPLAMAGTRGRFARAEQLLQQVPRPIDVPTLTEILRDHEGVPVPICRHPMQNLPVIAQAESVTGIVLDIGRRTMHVAAGIPCTVPFEPIALQA